uniref:U7-lycotoxin-Ls1a n=1 Tax=Lycosa singoriensis TaxID=434756 RepID=TX701_LYCSI|nr:RecName: Full=U7-lycotoxin-Ls1a; AltName: Full=Toxin-like structure LSTX-G1; Flags: Precursor [Lycosa singoriensis]ACI41377.1 toxin-like structure LSTX-G1 precursor [Lycosa singoriensis]CAS03646.1 toxin-like structure LSTX-G1 precursor [Lycosa singoriensis]
MKLIIFTGLALLLIVSLIDVEAQNEGACLPRGSVCTTNHAGCCSKLSCDCYRRFEKGVEKGQKCWCIPTGLRYSKEKE